MTIEEQLKVYCYYAGKNLQIGRTYHCPPALRIDRNESFSLYFNEKGDKIRWHDHSRGDDGDCLDIIMKIERVKFKEAIEFFRKRIGPLGIIPNVKYLTEYDKIIKTPLYGEEFSPKELEYWQKFGINEQQLKDNHIYSSRGIRYENTGKTIFKSSDDKIRFLYNLQLDPPTERQSFKLYGPKIGDMTKSEWSSQINNEVISGTSHTTLPTEGETLFMLSGKKDKMVWDNVAKLLGKDWHTDNPSAESAYRKMAKHEDRYKGFKNRYVLFDDDPVNSEGFSPGKRSTLKFIKEMKLEWKPIYLKCPPPAEGYEKCKDLADTVEQYSYDKLIECYDRRERCV